MDKTRRWFASLCTWTLLVTNLGVASSPSERLPPLPYTLIPYESTNYLGDVATLQKNEARYRDTPLWDEFAGTLGTAHSYVGNYREALRYFDSPAGADP